MGELLVMSVGIFLGVLAIGSFELFAWRLLSLLLRRR